MKKLTILAAGTLALCTLAASPPPDDNAGKQTDTHVAAEEPQQIKRLTEEDYREVAERLGVEVAAMKAVVEIEAGKTHQGFSAPGRPLVNFDLTMFRRHASKRGINLSKYYRSHPGVFNRRRRASQADVYRRLQEAMAINRHAAIEGTFWGMFQIGGFNWKKCGCNDIDEFMTLMSRTERDQLDLFAAFITSNGLLRHLKSKNWAAFARGYNGAGYASRGYHTRMASAYARYKRQEKSAPANAAKEQ